MPVSLLAMIWPFIKHYMALLGTIMVAMGPRKLKLYCEQKTTENNIQITMEAIFVMCDWVSVKRICIWFFKDNIKSTTIKFDKILAKDYQFFSFFYSRFLLSPSQWMVNYLYHYDFPGNNCISVSNFVCVCVCVGGGGGLPLNDWANTL